MLGVVGNLGYEYNPEILKKIIEQGAINLVANAITHFNSLDDVETSLCAIDTLGTIAHNKQICKIISEYKIVPPVVKLLKGQDWNSELVYKTTRCLYRICVDETLRNDAIDKKAHEVGADIIDKYFGEDRVLFNALRLMNTLISISDKETIEEVYDTGLCDKVIKKFYDELTSPIIKEIFLMFTKMATFDTASDEIARRFSGKCVQLISERINETDFIKAGIDLMNELAMLRSNIDPLFYSQTLPMTKNVMKIYEHSPDVNIPNLQIIEEFAKDSEPMRQECLAAKLDEANDVLMGTIDECMEPLYMMEARTVEMLLRGENKLDKKKPKEKMGLDDNETMELPIEVIQFLTAGRTMDLYGEDGLKRTFHFFMTKDLTDLICKRPNERRAKQKWLMPVNGIKDIVKGYDRGTKSPFETGTGFFSKNPDPNTCFSVMGPTTDEGNQNFHYKADNQEVRDKWVEYLNMVKKYQKITAKASLKKRREHE